MKLKCNWLRLIHNATDKVIINAVRVKTYLSIIIIIYFRPVLNLLLCVLMIIVCGVLSVLCIFNLLVDLSVS